MQAQKIDRTVVKAWTEGVPVSEKAWDQVRNIAALPFIKPNIAVMPDVHWGMGATVGSVIPTDGAIIPAAVGVDIGCGMMAARTSLSAEHLPDNLAPLRSWIEATVPHGRTDNGGPADRGAWREPPQDAQNAFAPFQSGLRDLCADHPKLNRAAARAPRHMGTLGTGNHFIEVCLDEAERVWVMLHSGSRGIGNAIGQYFIALAKDDMRRWFVNLPDANLAYFPEGTAHFDAYITAMEWAQDFAAANRGVMMERTLAALAEHVRSFSVEGAAINCHHNYAAREHHRRKNVWVIRKGTVRARLGDLGIIPGSMGARSYIVRGKGNADALHSCSHGAGRAMSRTEARRRFTVEEHAAATEGVECRKDDGVLDETPGAYKDIDAVMAAQADLVEIVHTLRQVVCVKG